MSIRSASKPRKTARLLLQAGCPQSLLLTMGATRIGTPVPIASQMTPSAYVSAIPTAALLIVLKVAGQITIAAGLPPRFGSDGERWATRGGSPISVFTASESSHASAIGVATTVGRQPSARQAATRSGVRDAKGAAHTTMVRSVVVIC